MHRLVKSSYPHEPLELLLQQRVLYQLPVQVLQQVQAQVQVQVQTARGPVVLHGVLLQQ